MAEPKLDSPGETAAPVSPGGNRVPVPEKLPSNFFLDRLQGDEAAPVEPEASLDPSEGPPIEEQEDIAEQSVSTDESGADIPADEADEDPEIEASSDDSEDSEDEADEIGIEVDGEWYSSEQIAEVVRSQANSEAERMTLEDYRRRSAYMNRIEDEHKALGEQFEVTAGVLEEVVNGNVKYFETLDWARLQAENPEQYNALLGQRNQAVQGRDFILGKIKERQEKIAEHAAASQDLAADRAVRLLQFEVPARFNQKWTPELYADVGKYAVNHLQMPEAQFNEIRDPLYLQGLLAIQTLDSTKKLRASSKRLKKRKKPAKSGNMQNQPAQARDTSGKFSSASREAHESTNAKADGSFRAMKAEELRRERED